MVSGHCGLFHPKQRGYPLKPTRTVNNLLIRQRAIRPNAIGLDYRSLASPRFGGVVVQTAICAVVTIVIQVKLGAVIWAFLNDHAQLFAIASQHPYDVRKSEMGGGEIFYLAASAAFFEEITYRGMLAVMLVRAESKIWSQFLYILVSATLFGLVHWEQGLSAILVVGLTGAAFCILYIWFRSLWPLIFGHFIYDVLRLS